MEKQGNQWQIPGGAQKRRGADRQASLMWLTNGFLHPEIEGFFSEIQDGVIRTKNYEKYVHNE